MTDYVNWVAPLDRVRSERNVCFTESLFYELSNSKTIKPVYTLSTEDKGEYVSAYQVYMHSIDEYDAAMKLVGSMKHWRKLCKLSWFMNGIHELGFEGLKAWRRDMLLRDQSAAKRKLQELADSGNVSAAKALLSLKPESVEIKDSKKKSKKDPKETTISSILDRMANK
jgi:hypothetical protein